MGILKLDENFLATLKHRLVQDVVIVFVGISKHPPGERAETNAIHKFISLRRDVSRHLVFYH